MPAQMWKLGLSLKLWRHHLRLDGTFVRLRRCAVTLFVLVLVGACVVVGGTLVLVRTAMLSRRSMISKIVAK